MKIVFIQPKSFFTWEALNIGYLSSYLKREGYRNIHFYSGFFDSDEQIIDACKDADIIGFSCTSPQFSHGLRLARDIKNSNNYIVFGGFHTSALPEDVLKYEFIDSVVVGEGEQAFLDIVKGNKKRIVQRPYIEDIDTIPFPDRQVIKQERNLRRCKRMHGRRIAALLSSRGCPFSCLFCASHSVWSRKVRLRSPENILEEFEKVVKDFNIDFVTFADDEVGVNKEQMIKFCQLKVKRNIKTPWGCNAVASLLDDEMLKTMRKANCTQLWMGVETGSPQILKDMRKPNTLETIKKAFDLTKKYGFLRRAYVILGMPNENYEDIELTDKLLENIQPDMVGFTILAPYPGTEFYNRDLHGKIDWSKVDEYQNDLTSTKYLSNKQLKKTQRRLVKKHTKIIAFRQMSDWNAKTVSKAN